MTAAASELIAKVEELNALVRGKRAAPHERVVAAAVKLHDKIKAWDSESRELIDAIYPRAAGDLGDFLIELDEVMK